MTLPGPIQQRYSNRLFREEDKLNHQVWVGVSNERCCQEDLFHRPEMRSIWNKTPQKITARLREVDLIQKK